MRNTQDLLSHSEECELVGIYQACCANGGELTAPAAMALDALVVSHLPLVRAIARRAHRATLRSIELDDLEAAGAEGLIEGIRKFDIHRGFRLSTYVRWWIQHHVSQEVRRTTWSMGIPKNMYEAIGKFRKGFKELLIELGRGPTRAELAQFFDVNPDIDAMVYVWISPETMSLSKPVGKSSTLTVADFIEDKSQLEANGVCSEENACDDYIKKIGDHILADFGYRDKLIIMNWLRMAAGLPGKTRQQIASEYSITSERIRQIESAGLVSIREWFELPAPIATLNGSSAP